MLFPSVDGSLFEGVVVVVGPVAPEVALEIVPEGLDGIKFRAVRRQLYALLGVDDFAWPVVWQPATRHERQERQAGEDQEPRLKRSQTRLRVDANRFVNLFWRGGRCFEATLELIVVDEIDVI